MQAFGIGIIEALRIGRVQTAMVICGNVEPLADSSS